MDRNLNKILDTFSKDDLQLFYEAMSAKDLKKLIHIESLLHHGLITPDAHITELGHELYSWLRSAHHLGQKIFYPYEYGAYINGISSSYSEFIDHLKFEQDVTTIVEIGTFNGGGTEYLIKSFPSAKIYTYESETPSDPQYSSLDILEKNLNGRAKLIREDSPPTKFNDLVDLCVSDIGGSTKSILENYHFWYSKLRPGGYLSMLIPWSTQKKRKIRAEVLKELQANSLQYTEYVNWVVIAK